MFAIPGIVAIIALIYARPQEFIEPLAVIPWLYIFAGVAIFGIALDLKLKNTRIFATPHLPFVAAFYIWAMVTVLLTAPRTLPFQAMELGISMVLFLIVALGVQSFRMLGAVTATVLAMVIFVAGVGVHQGFADTGCVLIDESVPGDHSVGTPDGRSCEVADECYLGDAEPDGHYLCERVGLFGTTSVSGGRVRYRGVLQDPNELALAGGIGMPIAFAFAGLAFARRRKVASRALLSVFTLALVLVCAILTQSRGGQLVILAVLGAYFLQRFGKKGLLVAPLLAIPVLLLGGREGAEAASSTSERIDTWYEAIGIWRAEPLFGVGFSRFGEYHYLTAHNSFLLTLAELGPLGLLLFSAIVYVSLKIPWVALQRYREGGESGEHDIAPTARVWAIALLSSMAGLAVGIFFLSFAYHYVLWIYLGIIAAFYSILRRYDGGFRVQLGWKDAVLCSGAAGVMVVSMFFFTRSMVG